MRLELTKRGDYAVRAMLCLARPGVRQLTAAQVARATAVPQNYVPQVMSELVRAGLVATRRGRAGGYTLARPAHEVSILAIVEAVEGDSRRLVCVMRGGPCGAGDMVCDVHEAFSRSQEAATGVLGSVSLADVVSGR